MKLPDGWNDTEARELGSIEPWTADRYAVIVTNAEEKTGPSGFPYIKLETKVIRGKETGNQYAGRKLVTNLSFHPKMAGTLKSILNYLKIKVSNDSVNVANFKNKKLGLDVGLQEYEGKTQPDVRNIIPVEEIPATQTKAAPADSSQFENPGKGESDTLPF